MRYVVLSLVAAVAVWPSQGEVAAGVRALLVCATTWVLGLYLGYELLNFLGVFGPNQIELGYLTSCEDALTLTIGGTEVYFPLDTSTVIELTYRGFKNEALTPRIRATGIDNFIQINGGETYRFEILTELAQENLRVELRRWYLRKVVVKEHRQDGRTFLLHRNLSYEQIQAYKQEFGVNLYG
jgi:hypothetical protein